jgi:putative methionine-R-sulfoxide reductase with GAF domain
VPIVVNNTANQIRSIAMGGDDRAEKGKRLAELVRKLGDYRWVGVYDVGAESVSILSWTGDAVPERSSFPNTVGLTGAAIQVRRAAVSGDVRTDSRYFEVFESTLSEIVIPVLSPAGGHAIGTVQVESEKPDAFSAADQQMIEQCAQAALPLWLLR